MNILIVYAHPEPKSFNGSMKDLAVTILREMGHHVQVSDLYKMNFQAVAGSHDFIHEDQTFFKYTKEQKMASENGTFIQEIINEHEKIKWADLIIFQFPLWWSSTPAILKGYFDRVFSYGFAYGPGIYNNANLKGKRAMLSITTGTSHLMYGPNKLKGQVDHALYHIQHDTLYFVGMDVLEPFIAWSAGSIQPEERETYLKEYENRLRMIESIPAIPFHKLEDYDDNYDIKKKISIS